MIRNNKKSLIGDLEKQGWVFTESVQKTLGTWLPSDADWNYRDIPHLKYIHSQVEGAVAFATDDLISSMFVQKIGPLKIVLTVVLMSSIEEGQLYFTSMGPFALVIDTSWIYKEGVGTTVTTSYSIGSPRFLKPLHRLAHKVLERNYKILMSEDLPMREQRAKLRARSYKFRQDTEGHSYSGSLRTSLTNVLKPPLAATSVIFSLDGVDQIARKFSNDEQNRHILAWINGNVLYIGPDFCSHEGADLENQPCQSSGLTCPWHGRNVKPLASLNTLDGTSKIEDQSVIGSVAVVGRDVSVQLVASDADF